MTALGALAGLLSGLLGVGGGFVLVPLLARYTELSLAAVVATSLMVVALTASLGAALAVLHGSMPPASAVLPFTAAVLAGMWGGRRLSARLRPAAGKAPAWLRPSAQAWRGPGAVPMIGRHEPH